jgi:hypothetical protein
MIRAKPTQPRARAARGLRNSRHGDASIRFTAPMTFAGLAIAAATLAACGGKTGLTKTEPVAPTAACAASATPASAPPYAVQFQFRNDTAASLFLLENCGSYDFGVSSCASGFSDRLNDQVFCACSCDNPQCGITCGACAPDQATEIAGGGSLRRPWSGVSATIALITLGECVDSRALPAGRYRVSVSVYATGTDALARTGPRVVSRDFELPAPSGVVDVPLASSPDDVCDGAPDAPAAVCTGGEARDVPCALASGLTFARDGGLSLFEDSELIAPPATDVHTRTSSDAATPPVTCTTKIPRCSRDARVTTTGDVARALAAPGVVSSFGTGTPVFGLDARSADGNIFVVTRPDGASVGIGATCTGCAQPLPPGLQALGSVLERLSAQQLADPACAVLAAGP